MLLSHVRLNRKSRKNSELFEWDTPLSSHVDSINRCMLHHRPNAPESSKGDEGESDEGIEDGEESEALAEDDQTEDENAEGTKAGKGQHSGDTQDGLGEDSEKEELAEEDQLIDRKDVQRRANEALKAVNNRRGSGKGNWFPVKLAPLPLTLTVQGAIGKKRVASQVGRNPRRISRILTDPERRIFDKKVRSGGGVVLIDCSGSMDLSKDGKRIGISGQRLKRNCLLLAWNEDENTYVLADKVKSSPVTCLALATETKCFPALNTLLVASKSFGSDRKGNRCMVIDLTEGPSTIKRVCALCRMTGPWSMTQTVQLSTERTQRGKEHQPGSGLMEGTSRSSP